MAESTMHFGADLEVSLPSVSSCVTSIFLFGLMLISVSLACFKNYVNCKNVSA